MRLLKIGYWLIARKIRNTLSTDTFGVEDMIHLFWGKVKSEKSEWIRHYRE
jgi:hypothetical protein